MAEATNSRKIYLYFNVSLRTVQSCIGMLFYFDIIILSKKCTVNIKFASLQIQKEAIFN